MKLTRNLVLSIVIILSAFVVLSCSTNQQIDNPGNVTEDNNEPIIIKHELDEIAIEKKPERVIVFDYGVLDILDNLEEEIIGLPKNNIPPYLDKYEDDKYVDVGTLKEPNFEIIYELEPDLVIISGRQADLYDEFKKIAPTLYLSIDGGDYINSFKSNLEILGKIFDKEELLAKEFEDLEDQINKLNDQAKSSGKNGLFIMANDGNLSAYGPGSRFGILHKEFGIQPVDKDIESSTHGAKITFEYIVEKDPDYIYVMDRAAVVGGDLSAKQVMDNDLMRSTEAYKNGNIIYLDAHVWYVSSGGLTGTRKMVEEIKSSLD